uniref:Envelope glycoprotein K n=1 Tax=Anatid alphaherpesvirus 2 TaxID=3080522 RepID=A0AAU0K8A2_9ALPH
MTAATTAGLVTIVLALGIYTVFVAVFALRLGHGGRGCLYAVIPDSSTIDVKNFTWEALNDSLIYSTLGSAAPTPSGKGPDYSDACRQTLIDPTVASALGSTQSGRDRLRLVVGTRNCAAYLWTTQLRFLGAAIVFYSLFYGTRQWRRMFGVVRFKRDRLSPTRYTGNYAARVMAGTVLRTRYTKMANFMCELAMNRSSFNRAFIADPITFMFSNPVAAALIVFEAALRVTAQCCAISVITSLTVPCAGVYTVMYKALTWMFIVAVVLAELALLLAPGPAEKTIMIGEVLDWKKQGGNSGGGRTPSIFVNCCATVLSGLFIKALHLLFVAAVIVALIKYEQKIQAALFGGWI